jgi:hypothetical protein
LKNVTLNKFNLKPRKMSTRSTGPVKNKGEKLIDKVKDTITEIWGSAEEAIEKLTEAEPQPKASKPRANTKPASKQLASGTALKGRTHRKKTVSVTKAVGTATKRAVAKKAAVTASALRKKNKDI